MLPIDAPDSDYNGNRVELNISQVELSPSFKYVKLPGSTEVRRSSLNTPPGKHVLTTEAAELCTTPKRLKSGAGADYQDNLVYYEPKSVSAEEAASNSTFAKE